MIPGANQSIAQRGVCAVCPSCCTSTAIISLPTKASRPYSCDLDATIPGGRMTTGTAILQLVAKRETPVAWRRDSKLRRISLGGRSAESRGEIGRSLQSRFPKPDAPSLSGADDIVADQLNSGSFQRLNNLHQGIDHAPHLPPRGFHSLNGGHRKPGHLRELALVDTEEGARRSHLGGSDHGS